MEERAGCITNNGLHDVLLLVFCVVVFFSRFFLAMQRFVLLLVIVTFPGHALFFLSL